MARKKQWGLMGLLASLTAVLVAAIALPGAAWAAINDPQSYQFTINGLQAGDTVNVYQVIDYEYEEETDIFAWDFISNGSADLEDSLEDAQIERDAYNDPNFAAVADAATVMAQYVDINNVGPVYTGTVAEGATSVQTSALGVGQYLVVVTPGQDTSGVIYQYSILNVQPERNEQGDWDIKAYSKSKGDKETSTTVTLKSSDIPFEKTTTDGGNSQAASTDDYRVGQKVPFTITTQVPTYGDDVDNPTFKISDTMGTGLSFNETDNPVTVTIGSAQYSVADGEAAGLFDFTATTNGFVIAFDYPALKTANFAGLGVVVSYTATITQEAVQTNPSTNGATLEYTNNGQVNTSYDKVDVYTYAIDLTKVDAGNEETKLSGAVFGLYTTQEAAADATAENPGSGDTFVGTVRTNDNGTASFEDLGEGTYYLKELTAPEGYQLDETIIRINLSDENTESDGQNDGAVVNHVYAATITNALTPSLPVTGGEGTIAITATGVVLIAGAAALIVRARRQHNN